MWCVITFTAEQVLELLNDDFDASEGEESDFGDDELYSYLPGDKPE